MAAQKPYIGDIGTEIIIDVGEDITGATVSMNVLKPGGTKVVWDASVYSVNAVTTFARHTVVAGDFDVPGVYRIQPYVALADGTWAGRGDTVEIKVYDDYQ